MEKDTGKKLKELREEHGLSQEKFANEIGVSRQIVSRWEKGKVIPNVSSVKKICDYYGISTSLLLNTNIPVDEEEDKSQPVAKKIINKKVLIKGIAIFLLLLIVLYMIYSVYKYFLLKDLEEKFKEYNNWTNYYAEIRTVEEAKLTGKTEIWYKDSQYKIKIEKYFEDSRTLESYKYIDLINKTIYEKNQETGETIKKENINNFDIYEKGHFLRNTFTWLEFMDKKNIIKNSIEPYFITYISNNKINNLIIDNKIIKLKPNSLIPLRCIDNNNDKIVIKYYNIQIDCVQDEDIKKDL